MSIKKAGMHIGLAYGLLVLLALLQIALADAAAYAGFTVAQLQDKIKELSAQGNSKEVLDVYSAIIAKEPDYYLHYYKRAITYLSMGRTLSAADDLDRVISLKPDFDQALSSRGSIKFKQGKFALAEEDYKKVLKINPNNQAAKQKVEEIRTCQYEIAQADALLSKGQHREAIPHLTLAMESAPHYDQIRMKRADAFMILGDIEMAMNDYKYAVHLKHDNFDALLKLAQLHFSIGELDQSLEKLKDCLHYDPEHKGCFTYRKKVKAIHKYDSAAEKFINTSKWDLAAAQYLAALKEIESNNNFYFIRFNKKACHCYLKMKKGQEAIDYCTHALSRDENDLDALIDRAEAALLMEDYEAAVRDYKKAQSISQEQRVLEGLQKAEGLLKQSKSVDYYKILGVSRTAPEQEIKKAYRKLAQEWHPDKYKGEDKEKAEKKMAQINLAYEVLSDEELRKKYDVGEDPNDPQRNQGGNPWGGNPFGSPFHFHQGGGNPFGGGGFQFRFN